MGAIESKNKEPDHPFGGCNRLLRHYRMVGGELIKFEARSRALGAFDAFREFRENVAFVPVEVLEGYLEDLLDLEVSDQQLFLENEKNALMRRSLISMIGLAGAMGAGLYHASRGDSFVLSCGVTLMLALPFILFWYFYTPGGLARRVRFAQVVSHEISRRRGLHKGDGPPSGARLVVEELLGRRVPQSTSGAHRQMLH